METKQKNFTLKFLLLGILWSKTGPIICQVKLRFSTYYACVYSQKQDVPVKLKMLRTINIANFARRTKSQTSVVPK